jgi:hypothetical protein
MSKGKRSNGKVVFDVETNKLKAFGTNFTWNTVPGTPLDDIRRALGLSTEVEPGNVQFQITQAVQLSLDRAGARGYVLRWRVEEPNYPEVVVPNLTEDLTQRIVEELKRTGIVGIGVDLADAAVYRREVNMAMSFGDAVNYERIVIGAGMQKLGRKAPPPPPTLAETYVLGAHLEAMKLP